MRITVRNFTRLWVKTQSLGHRSAWIRDMPGNKASRVPARHLQLDPVVPVRLTACN